MKKLLLFGQGSIPPQVEKQVRERFSDCEILENNELNFSVSKIFSCIARLIKNHSVCLFYVQPPLTYFKKVILLFLCLFSRAGEKIIMEGEKNEHKITASFYLKDLFMFPFSLIISLISLIFSLFFAIISGMIFRKPANLKERVESKKIACIYTIFGLNKKVGGNISHIKGVVDSFTRQGFAPLIFSFDKIGLVEGNYRIIDHPLNKFIPGHIAQMLFNITAIPSIFQSMKKETPAFIYQRHSPFNISGAVLSHLTGLPLILEVNAIIDREESLYFKKKFLSSLIFFYEKICFGAAHKVLSITNKLRDELIDAGVSKERIFVNPNGVDVDLFKPGVGGKEIREKFCIRDKTVIGFSGTFAVWHGTETLKAVALKILSDFPSSTFMFVGDGPEKNKVESVLKEKFSEDRVIFTGLVSPDEVPLYLDACDILISPIGEDKANSSPIKIFEYMATGKPIVCYGVGQMSEILEDGKTALLVSDSDIEGFIASVIKLISDPDLRRSVGGNARETVVSKYTWAENTNKIIDNFEQLYQRR